MSKPIFFKPTLKPGDYAALLCPGSLCLQAEDPQLAADYVKTHWQLKPILPPTIHQKLSPEARATLFLEALFDPSIKLIAALRGGEGAADLLPYLQPYEEEIKKLPPKYLLGFSDFTVLLVYFSQQFNWPVIHGSSPLAFAKKTVDTKTSILTEQLLLSDYNNNNNNNKNNNHPSNSGCASSQHSRHSGAYAALQPLTPLNSAAKNPGEITAALTGGCLSLLNISIGDSWEVCFRNKIILLEDVGEKAHVILRTLKYFSRLGLFQHARAVIFGDMACQPIGNTPEERSANDRAIHQAFASFAKHHENLPVLSTTGFGHGRRNWPWQYVQPYCLHLGHAPSLRAVTV